MVFVSHIFFVTHILHMYSPHIYISELHVGRASWFVFATGPEIYQTGPEFDFFYWRVTGLNPLRTTAYRY
jgi:hypothetical protein